MSAIRWCIGAASQHDGSAPYVHTATAALEKMEQVLAAGGAVVEAWKEGYTPTTEIRALERALADIDAITTPEEAKALPVGTVLVTDMPFLTATKRDKQYADGSPGWWVKGFRAPLGDGNTYPVKDATLFRYARAWRVQKN